MKLFKASSHPIILFILSIVIFYTIGFIFGENSSGGAIKDYYNFHHPAVIHFDTLPLSIAILDYSSASTPLFYMLHAYLNPFIYNDIIYRLTNLLSAFSILFLFFHAIKTKYGYLSTSHLLLLSSIIAISPYFKSAAIWASNDNLPYLFLILSIIIFQRSNENSDYIRYSLIILFSILAALTRQYYIIFTAYFLYELISRDADNVHRNTLLLSFAIILSLPFLYLLYLWSGLTPPSFASHSHLSLNSLPYAFSFIAFYSMPFILFILYNFLTNIKSFDRHILFQCLLYITCGIIYLIFFYNFSFYEKGGGFIVKALQLVDTESGLHISEISFILFSMFGFLFSIYFISLSKHNIILALPLLFLLTTNVIYQKYADPLLNIVLLLLVNFGIHEKTIFHNKKFIVSLFLYNLSFYLIAATYYNFILIRP